MCGYLLHAISHRLMSPDSSFSQSISFDGQETQPPDMNSLRNEFGSQGSSRPSLVVFPSTRWSVVKVTALKKMISNRILPMRLDPIIYISSLEFLNTVSDVLTQESTLVWSSPEASFTAIIQVFRQLCLLKSRRINRPAFYFNVLNASTHREFFVQHTPVGFHDSDFLYVQLEQRQLP